MTFHAIETRALTKRYGKVLALDGLDLTVPAGSVFGFLGPNGAGKSTTIKLLLDLITPTDGTATVLGHDAHRDGVAARRGIGYLPQQPRFHPYRSVRQVLLYSAHLRPGAPRGRALRRRVDDLLDQAGLAAKARRRSGVLSGGELQRLGLAAALVARPELLILDEPAAGLDPSGRRDVLELLEELRGDSTVFFSTHLLDDVQRVSDAVAVIAGGRSVAHGSLEEVLRAPAAAFTVRVRDGASLARARVEAADWCGGIDVHRRGDQEVWDVQLADAGAGTALLDTILDAGDARVIEFHPTDPSLEAAYLDLVGVGADVGGSQPPEGDES